MHPFFSRTSAKITVGACQNKRPTLPTDALCTSARSRIRAAMFGRDAPRRSARLSPPGAGAPSGASVAKGDIAPVAKEPDFRTPGKSLANRAPWRSPGAALRDRDRENNYVSARKKAVRKLSARSPATAAMASGANRNGRPRFTPAEMRTPSVTPSKNLVDDHDDRDDETKTTETESRQERTPLADLASVPVTTVLLTPPSTRSRSRAAEADDARAAAASEADAKAAMPPPPPKPRVSPLANVTTNPFLPDDEATMKVPALAPYNAAFEALQMGTAAASTSDDPNDEPNDDRDDDDDEPEELAGQRDASSPSASPALSLFAPTEVGDDSVLIADADADGSIFGGDRSMNLENGDDDLPTPTTTSAFDAALDIAAATVAIPAFSADAPGETTGSRRASKTPSRDILDQSPKSPKSPPPLAEDGGISANEISTGFLGPAALVAAGSTLKEMLAEAAGQLAVPDDDAEEDPELDPTLGQPAAGTDAASSPRAFGGHSEEGGRVPAGAVLDAIAHPQDRPVSESAAVSAPSPIAALSPPTLEPAAPTREEVDAFAEKAFDESPLRQQQPAATPSPVRRSPRLAAMRTASFTPASPAVVELDAAPTAAERRAAELQALVERQAMELLEQREALERQQMMMRSEASRQAAQLEAQREAMMNQKRQMENEARLAFQRAEVAAQEQARMRAEFQAQLEARRAEEDATRARLAAMASEAAAAKEEAARAARAAAEAAEVARRQPPAPSPFPLDAVKSVEDELRACREELRRRSAESAAVSQRMQTLQREETELFNRAAELQRRMLEMVIKGNPKISPAAAAALAQPLISSVSSGVTSGASAMPPPPPRMMDVDLSLARPGEVVDAIAAAAEMVLQPRQPTMPMVSMDSLAAAAAAATPSARAAPSLTPLAPMSAGVARAMEAAVAPSVVDEDGFIVMDYAANYGASMPVTDAARVGDVGNGVFMTPAMTPPGQPRALEMASAAADACPALVMTPSRDSASKRGGCVGTRPETAGIATRRHASQIVELRKEVVNLQFLGGHEGGTSAGMLMAASKDGAVRLFAPGSRRAAAMIRGPKQGLAAAVAAGTEAFIAAAGRDAHVARHDLATGRELGVLLPTMDGVQGPELTCIRGGGASGGPVVVAAGEGGDVFLWDVRAAPRVASRRSSLVGAAATPAMTMHVPGASRTLSLSLSDALGGGAHGTAPASLALVASNGGRVFDLRAPGRPARLAPAESGQRWVACAHAGRSDDVLTLSAQGDLATWRCAGGLGLVGGGATTGLNYRIAGPVLREVAAASGAGARAVLSTSAPVDGIDGVTALTTTGETGDGFRVFDASTGDVVAEWGGDGERTDVGVGAMTSGSTMMTAGVGGWRRSGRDDETRPSITAAGWGCGATDGSFGGSSFAVGTSDGVVRVYGPGA